MDHTDKCTDRLTDGQMVGQTDIWFDMNGHKEDGWSDVLAPKKRLWHTLANKNVVIKNRLSHATALKYILGQWHTRFIKYGL